MRAQLPHRPGPAGLSPVGRVLEDHADALYDFALAVTDCPVAAVDVVREAVPQAVAKYGPSVTRAALLGQVFEAALLRTEPSPLLPGDLLEAGEGTHEELRRVCQEAGRVLEPRNRGILDLTLRQGLVGEQLGAAMGVSPGQVSAATKSAIAEAEHVVGAVLLSRVAQDDCPGLAAVLEVIPSGSEATVVAEEIIAHQENCPACEDRRRALVPVTSLLAGIPATPAPPELRTELASAFAAGPVAAPPARRVNPRQARAVKVLAVTSLVLLAGSVAAAVTRNDDGQADQPVPAGISSPTLALSTMEINFRKDASETTFEVTNTGDQPAAYDVKTAASWLALTLPGPRLGPGETALIVAKLDRSQAPEGQIQTEVRLGPAGEAPLNVRAEVDRAPVVSKAEITPESLSASRCPGAAPGQVRVTMVEESGIARARVHWKGAGAGERSAPLEPAADGTYVGALGAVAAAGEVTWWVQAEDTRGNSTVTAPSPLTITGC